MTDRIVKVVDRTAEIVDSRDRPTERKVKVTDRTGRSTERRAEVTDRSQSDG